MLTGPLAWNHINYIISHHSAFSSLLRELHFMFHVFKPNLKASCLHLPWNRTSEQQFRLIPHEDSRWLVGDLATSMLWWPITTQDSPNLFSPAKTAIIWRCILLVLFKQVQHIKIQQSEMDCRLWESKCLFVWRKKHLPFIQYVVMIKNNCFLFTTLLIWTSQRL